MIFYYRLEKDTPKKKNYSTLKDRPNDHKLLIFILNYTSLCPSASKIQFQYDKCEETSNLSCMIDLLSKEDCKELPLSHLIIEIYESRDAKLHLKNEDMEVHNLLQNILPCFFAKSLKELHLIHFW